MFRIGDRLSLKDCDLYEEHFIDALIHLYRYKYKFLGAATKHIPSSVLKDNRGSKFTIGRGGMLKIQHLVSVGRIVGNQHFFGDPVTSGNQQPSSRIAYIEFYVKPEEEED